MTGVERLGLRPALTGVRGIAVLLVMLHHAQVPGFESGGDIGVALFFVLSGFLITRILVEERSRNGRIDLRRFYTRRVRRLVPALLLMLSVVIPVQIATGFGSLGAVAALTYTSNVFMSLGADLGLTSHTWSLAVEEQFYLVWPLALLVLRGRALLATIAALALASTVVREVALVDLTHTPFTAFSTPTNAVSLLAGCGLAVLPWHRIHGLAAATAAMLMALLLDVNVAVVQSLIPLVACSAAMVIGWSVHASGPVGALLTSRWLTYVGTISYGLYLWHAAIATFLLRGAAASWAVCAAISFTVAFGVAAVSWRYVEQPILRRGVLGLARTTASSTRRSNSDDEVATRSVHGSAAHSSAGEVVRNGSASWELPGEGVDEAGQCAASCRCGSTNEARC